jgi:hypothetical protein
MLTVSAQKSRRMSRISIGYAEPPPPPPPRWTKVRWAAWLTLFIALGVWLGLILSA